MSDEPKRLTVAEAGRLGGKATSERYGKEFYRKNGRKGGEKMKRLLEAGRKALEQEGSD